MKRLIICLGFIISMLMSGVVTAQNDNELNKSAKNSLQEKDREITAQKWENSIEPFVGVWSLEKSSIDDQEEEITAYPCTFMVINPKP